MSDASPLVASSVNQLIDTGNLQRRKDVCTYDKRRQGAISLDIEAIRRWRQPTRTIAYDEAFTILYHLGAGAGVLAASDERGLSYVWEERLRCLPSFASVLKGGDYFFLDPHCGVEEATAVYAAEAIEILRPLRPVDTLQYTCWVEAVHDKGPSRGAIVEQVSEVGDLSGRPVARSRSAVFVKHGGGFGGTDQLLSKVAMPPGPATGEWSLDTRPEQALIYRLVNDRARLHVDPAFAREAGYPAPILHGLAGLGYLTLLLVVHELENNPARVASLEGRFVKPIYPGERLTLRTWRPEARLICFQGLVAERVVIDCGRLKLHEDGPV
jgi:acyl dehydratase